MTRIFVLAHLRRRLYLAAAAALAVAAQIGFGSRLHY